MSIVLAGFGFSRPPRENGPMLLLFFCPPNEIKHSSEFSMNFHEFSKPKNRKMTLRWWDKKNIIIIIIGPFSRGGLEKPNPARTIDTLADGS